MKRFALLFSILLLFSCQREEPYIRIEGSASYTLKETASVISFRVSTNAASWEYDLGDATWLTEKSKEGTDLYLNVAANPGPADRNATIVFYAPSKGAGSAMASVSVLQKALVADPEVTVLQLLEASAQGDSFRVDVTTNQASWEAGLIDESVDWITLSAESNVLVVDVAPNVIEYQRKATVRVYAPGKSNLLVYKDISVAQAPLEIHYDPETLSAEGSSNCYIITHKGEYSFDARIRGNGASTSGLSAPAPLEPAGAKLVWQTEKGMIESVSYNDGAISFVAGKIHGSAVIAATNSAGEIIWSWHIWFPSVPVEELECVSGSKIMSLNLGALDNEPANISSHGMLYQWGRKDPFPYSPYPNNGSITTMPIKVYDIDGNVVPTGHTDMYGSRDNSLAFSIAHPETCISNNYQYASCRDWLLPAESNGALWGNPSGDEKVNGAYLRSGSKSIYDPCPLGWKVASIKDYVYMTESGGYTWATGDTQSGFSFNDLGGAAEVAIVDIDGDGVYTMKDYQDGWTIYLNKYKNVQSFFPAATRYDGQYAMLMGSMVGLWGNYWTNSANNSSGATPGLAVGMSFAVRGYNGENNITISPVASGSRADAYSVRCIKE